MIPCNKLFRWLDRFLQAVLQILPRQLSATACLLSGSRTLQLGLPGRIIAGIGRESLSRFLGFIRRSFAIWRGTSGWSWLSMMRRRSAKFASFCRRLMWCSRVFVFIDGRRIARGCGTPGASLLLQGRALPGWTAEGGRPHMNPGAGRGGCPHKNLGTRFALLSFGLTRGLSILTGDMTTQSAR